MARSVDKEYEIPVLNGFTISYVLDEDENEYKPEDGPKWTMSAR